MSHGHDTLGRYLLAHALMGGILFATIVHPINFIYGCAAGTIYAGLMTSTHSKSFPRNFELHIKSADP
jgi:ABC-type Mn2+/Zn2+ transport system permease subunit